ncbi:MAG: DMT family transporter [Thermomicrobium sp.]|nr:DMT family transporter [Thermomicrobium sp.]
MQASQELLALGAAMAWGTADFLAGVATRRHHPAVVVFAVQAIGLAAVVPFWVVLDRGRSAYAPLVAAGLAMAVGLGALYRGLARGPIRIVAPVTALGAGVPVVFGAFRGEELSATQAAGVALGLVGIVALTASERGETSLGQRPLVGAVAHGAVAALGLGSSVALLGSAGESGPFAATGLVRLVAAALAGAVALAVARRRRRAGRGSDRRALALLGGAGVLDATANAALVLAAARGTVGSSGFLASLYPAVTVLLGVAILGERLDRRQVGGFALVLAGVVLVRG